MSRKRIHPLPSIAELHARFSYDPQTGQLTHRLTHREYAKRGQVAATAQKSGYIVVATSGNMILAHRVAWAMHHNEWPVGELDHRDNDKSNNRIDNLRLATRAQQRANIPGRAKSGFKGVRAFGHYFRAKISANNKQYTLGRYDTAEAASIAYQKAAKTLHGEFANIKNLVRGAINAPIEFKMS